ncbi:maleylpyruvate isomerase family mycothiol-dependent enzyme [Planctomonas psychrotolerans]|uniref:maleylpyruvate isomerase family mycothiol-dependent enzyme n=1 Tax=Planctomonas psychrotolerans TaxID=2528712 RepID=UPI0012398ED1|nr:maleylpyruvate isomerase family mycothiol-dependent enzyme [Planctomonas psychrotolerans]
MNDIARFLPLSNAGRASTGIPETKVTTSWSTEIATILEQVADLLDGLTPEQWESPSMCDGWTVRDVAGHIVWRIGSSTGTMLRTGFRAYWGHHINPMKAIDDLSVKAAQASYEDLVDRIREIADDKRSSRGRVRIGELIEAVVHAYDISHALKADLALDPRATGAVAVARVVMAPTPIRAVLRARTLTATDAGWTLGSGTPLSGTASTLIMFLFGRKARPTLGTPN